MPPHDQSPETASETTAETATEDRQPPAPDPCRCDDPFRILGVTRTAPPATVKAAFRERVLSVHPDHAETDSRDDFEAVHDAYQTVLAHARAHTADDTTPGDHATQQRTGPTRSPTATTTTAHADATTSQSHTNTDPTQTQTTAQTQQSSGTVTYSWRPGHNVSWPSLTQLLLAPSRVYQATRQPLVRLARHWVTATTRVEHLLRHVALSTGLVSGYTIGAVAALAPQTVVGTPTASTVGIQCLGALVALGCGALTLHHRTPTQSTLGVLLVVTLSALGHQFPTLGGVTDLTRTLFDAVFQFSPTPLETAATTVLSAPPLLVCLAGLLGVAAYRASHRAYYGESVAASDDD